MAGKALDHVIWLAVAPATPAASLFVSKYDNTKLNVRNIMLGVYLYVEYLGVCFMQCLEYQVSCERFESYHCRYLVSLPSFVLVHAARGIFFYTYKASLLSFSRYHESQVSSQHFLQYPGNQVSWPVLDGSVLDTFCSRSVLSNKSRACSPGCILIGYIG